MSTTLNPLKSSSGPIVTSVNGMTGDVTVDKVVANSTSLTPGANSNATWAKFTRSGSQTDFYYAFHNTNGNPFVDAFYEGKSHIQEIYTNYNKPLLTDLSGTLAASHGGTGTTALLGRGGAVSTMFDTSLEGTAVGQLYAPVFTTEWEDGGYLTLQNFRNKIGLGNTTGALPIANGGTGTTSIWGNSGYMYNAFSKGQQTFRKTPYIAIPVLSSNILGANNWSADDAGQAWLSSIFPTYTVTGYGSPFPVSLTYSKLSLISGVAIYLASFDWSGSSNILTLSLTWPSGPPEPNIGSNFPVFATAASGETLEPLAFNGGSHFTVVIQRSSNSATSITFAVFIPYL